MKKLIAIALLSAPIVSNAFWNTTAYNDLNDRVYAQSDGSGKANFQSSFSFSFSGSSNVQGNGYNNTDYRYVGETYSSPYGNYFPQDVDK